MGITHLDVVQSDFEDDVPLSEIQQSLRVTLSPEQRKGPQRMLKKLPKLAMACDRHFVSDRSAAAIASAMLEDFGIVSKDFGIVLICFMLSTAAKFDELDNKSERSSKMQAHLTLPSELVF